MRITSSRALSSVVALAAASLLAVGCSTGPGATPAPTSTADDSPSASNGATGAPQTGDDHDADDVEVAWLDDGRGIAVITWGSSSCVPSMGDAVADGQRISVELVDGQETACTDDLSPRALFVPVPEGVDVTQEVEVEVRYGSLTEDADLDGLAAAPTGESGQKSSAGWFDDSGIALLTWGSSSCPPMPESVEMTDAGATVTFTQTDRVCTMDFAPRVTVIDLPQERDDDAPFTLTLVGDNLDAEVDVLRG